MSKRRLEKVNSLLRQLTAEYLAKKINSCLLTITRVETSNDLKSAKIFISIFPENKEKEILEFLKSKVGELRKFIGLKIKMKFLPILEFKIDQGEKAKKKIEEILSAVVK
jgi:ribosome-binding factor A